LFITDYSTEHFFKYIVTQIDFDKELDFETQTNGKEYSFVCKTIKDLGCINIYGRDVRTEKKNQAELNRLSLVASTNVNAVILQHLMALSIGPMKVLKLTGYSLQKQLEEPLRIYFKE
jgi:hypothetical protein